MSNPNYFHSGEAGQFSFFRIPRALIKDARFHGLSTDAKLLYGLMLQSGNDAAAALAAAMGGNMEHLYNT